MLLHGVGTSAGEWTWVLRALARNNLVYAIDLPGYDGSAEPPDYAPAFTARFVSAFLDAAGVESAVVVASSFGGLVALHLALSEPERVSALVLADSAGLDRVVNPAFAALAFPKGSEELMAAWTRTPLGAAHRVSVRAFFLFARPWQIPVSWLTGQYKVAQLPNFTRTELAALRATINLAGQREMLLDRLPRLQMPTLIVWEPRTDCFLSCRQKTRPLVCQTASSSSSLTAATSLTSSAPKGSYRSSASFWGACSS